MQAAPVMRVSSQDPWKRSQRFKEYARLHLLRYEGGDYVARQKHGQRTPFPSGTFPSILRGSGKFIVSQDARGELQTVNALG